ncbi:MAG: hypothetical protein V4717_06165 [Bacteroidota bacterium]
MHFTKLILQTVVPEVLYDFYRNDLQLQAQKLSIDVFEIITRDTIIRFIPAVQNTSPTYHFALNIPSNKIIEAHDWLKEHVPLLWLKEYNSEIADFVNWNAKSVYFIDPAGNVVELIARFDLQDDEQATFSPLQIRNVSEIGLVLGVDNFEEQITAFMHGFSLRYFDKQPPLPSFRAIGNNHGLFIAVPENRVWYPTTNSVSKKAPVHIEWTDGTNTFSYTQ